MKDLIERLEESDWQDTQKQYLKQYLMNKGVIGNYDEIEELVEREVHTAIHKVLKEFKLSPRRAGTIRRIYERSPEWKDFVEKLVHEIQVQLELEGKK